MEKNNVKSKLKNLSFKENGEWNVDLLYIIIHFLLLDLGN